MERFTKSLKLIVQFKESMNNPPFVIYMQSWFYKLKPTAIRPRFLVQCFERNIEYIPRFILLEGYSLDRVAGYFNFVRKMLSVTGCSWQPVVITSIGTSYFYSLLLPMVSIHLRPPHFCDRFIFPM